MTNQLASLEQRDYFYLDPLSSVNLGTYIIITDTHQPPPVNTEKNCLNLKLEEKIFFKLSARKCSNT